MNRKELIELATSAARTYCAEEKYNDPFCVIWLASLAEKLINAKTSAERRQIVADLTDDSKIKVVCEKRFQDGGSRVQCISKNGEHAYGSSLSIAQTLQMGASGYRVYARQKVRNASRYEWFYKGDTPS